MTELFGRKLSLQVDTLVIEGLDVRFDVVKSLAPKTPNSCTVEVWNLNADHRKHLQELEKVYVSLTAGYEQGTSLLFRGDLNQVVSRRDGVNWVTTVTAQTARRGRKKRIVKSFAPKASVRSVLEAIAKAMGVRLGNAAVKTVTAAISDTDARLLFNGYSLAGDTEDELDRIAYACGLEWSVQDDELQFLDLDRPLQELGIVLSPQTGLVGSPEPGNRGLICATCLMLPDVFPGRRVQLHSEHVVDICRVETSRHRGGTVERDWYIELELRSETRREPT